MDHQQKKDKTERATGLGRRTREETGKGNQMTALRSHAAEGHLTSLATISEY